MNAAASLHASGHTAALPVAQAPASPSATSPVLQTHRRHRGFSLLETIVVLALLAILMLLTWSAIGVARRAHEQGQRWDRALSQTDAAQTYLRRALMHAQIDRTTVPGRPALPAFFGSAQRMQFLAPAPAVQDNTGPKFNELYVEGSDGDESASTANGGVKTARIPSSGGTHWLTLQLSEVGVNGTIQPWGTAQRLAGPLSNITFSYRGANAAGKDTGWLPRWPWPARLPRMVRIAATPSDGSTWTTMQIPLVLQIADQQGNGS